MQKRPSVFVLAVKGIAAVAASKNRLSRDSGAFDFRLLQQYLPTAVMPEKSAFDAKRTSSLLQYRCEIQEICSDVD
jgi:hypothetical protein